MYTPFKNAREEAIVVIRCRAKDLELGASNAVDERVYDNYIAVARELILIANEIEGKDVGE